MKYRKFAISQQLLSFGFIMTVLHICSAKSPVLDYDEATLIDDYNYDDVGGKSEKTSAVEEREKPKAYFTNSNSSKIAEENDTVVLYCDVKNLGKDNIIVWSNGSSIITQSSHVFGSNPRIHVLGNSAIQISNVQSFDSNKYRCLVLPDNIYHDVDLKVERTPKVVIYSYNRDVTSRSVTYKEGDEVELECKALNMANYSVKWSFKGDRVKEGVTPDGKILIAHIGFEQAGMYSCLVDDNSKRPPLGTVVVNVNYAPRIFAHHHFTNTIHGDNAALTCEYSANPIATSDWKRNGRPLHRTSNKYFKEDESNKTILHVKNVEDSDLGLYECDLQNPIGKTVGKVHLVFEPEPAHFDYMETDNNSVILNWQIGSKQELLTVELEYKNNMSENWHHVEKLQFQEKAGTPGIYIVKHKFSVAPGLWHARVRSKNTAGWAKYSHIHNFQINEPIEKPHEAQDIIATAGVGMSRNDSNSSRSSITFAIQLSLALLLWSIAHA